jgi:hypothetical protein
MAKDPNLQELNDSKRELAKELRRALTLAIQRPTNPEHLSELIERVRNALLITEQIVLMLK